MLARIQNKYKYKLYFVCVCPGHRTNGCLLDLYTFETHVTWGWALIGLFQIVLGEQYKHIKLKFTDLVSYFTLYKLNFHLNFLSSNDSLLYHLLNGDLTIAFSHMPLH